MCRSIPMSVPMSVLMSVPLLPVAVLMAVPVVPIAVLYAATLSLPNVLSRQWKGGVEAAFFGKCTVFRPEKFPSSPEIHHNLAPMTPPKRVKNRDIPPLFFVRFWSLIACRVGKNSCPIHHGMGVWKWSKSTILGIFSPKIPKNRKNSRFTAILSFLGQKSHRLKTSQKTQ